MVKKTWAQVSRCHGNNSYGNLGLAEDVNPSLPDPGRKEKINVNFYFHTSLWCLKRFYKGGLNLVSSSGIGAGMVNVRNRCIQWLVYCIA